MVLKYHRRSNKKWSGVEYCSENSPDTYWGNYWFQILWYHKRGFRWRESGLVVDIVIIFFLPMVKNNIKMTAPAAWQNVGPAHFHRMTNLQQKEDWSMRWSIQLKFHEKQSLCTKHRYIIKYCLLENHYLNILEWATISPYKSPVDIGFNQDVFGSIISWPTINL